MLSIMKGYFAVKVEIKSGDEAEGECVFPRSLKRGVRCVGRVMLGWWLMNFGRVNHTFVFQVGSLHLLGAPADNKCARKHWLM